MAKNKYTPSAEVTSLMLDFSMARSATGRPVEGEEWLTKAMSLETAILEAKIALAKHVYPGNLPNESAIRHFVDEQEVSNIFKEALDHFPYSGEYVAALMQDASAPESGLILRIASIDPLMFRYAYEPWAIAQ